MLVVTIDMALKQGYEVTARCHDSDCDWSANPLSAPWFVWFRDPLNRLREANSLSANPLMSLPKFALKSKLSIAALWTSDTGRVGRSIPSDRALGFAPSPHRGLGHPITIPRAK